MSSVFRPGERCGPYEIGRLLGSGGMSEVYLGKTETGEERAIKVLSPAARVDDELATRFRREVQVLSYLEHAHIVRFFECGVLELAEGRQALWVALEYLQGRSLREVIAASGGRVDVATIIRYGRAIADGVEEAHKLQVIHRDLKPENVIITNDDMAKVIDFGIAKLKDWGGRNTTGAKVGTLLYMAPEQLDDTMGIDARTDVYALGLILFELACGRSPYLGEDGSLDVSAVILQKLSGAPPPVSRFAPGLPGDVARIIDRACAHDPMQRYPSMGAIGDALAAVRRRIVDERSGDVFGGKDPIEAPTARHAPQHMPRPGFVTPPQPTVVLPNSAAAPLPAPPALSPRSVVATPPDAQANMAPPPAWTGGQGANANGGGASGPWPPAQHEPPHGQAATADSLTGVRTPLGDRSSGGRVWAFAIVGALIGVGGGYGVYAVALRRDPPLVEPVVQVSPAASSGPTNLASAPPSGTPAVGVPSDTPTASASAATEAPSASTSAATGAPPLAGGPGAGGPGAGGPGAGGPGAGGPGAGGPGAGGPGAGGPGAGGPWAVPPAGPKPQPVPGPPVGPKPQPPRKILGDANLD